jgi:hypothetical protein
MLKITVPRPCNEDWEAMTPRDQGRHCTACVKTVVDFTAMPDEEVKNYLLQRRAEKICGRFRQEQLHRIVITLPTNILHITMPRWKQFLTACLLAFSSMLFSCDALIEKLVNGQSVTEIESTVVGALVAPVIEEIDTTTIHIDTASNCTTLTGDTVLVEEPTTGLIDMPVKNNFIPQYSSNIKTDDEKIFTGEIALDSNVISSAAPIDSIKIKNPPSDSINCNTMKYY